MLHINIITCMLNVNLKKYHVNINMSPVDIMMLHVKMIDLSCLQKYFAIIKLDETDFFLVIGQYFY